MNNEPLLVLGIRCLLQQLPPNRVNYQFSFATRIDPNLSATVGTIFDEATLSSNETPLQTDAEISPIVRQNPIPPAPPPPRPDDNNDTDQDDAVSGQSNTEPPASAPTPAIAEVQATPTMPVQFLPETGLREATSANNSSSKRIILLLILIGLSLIILWKWSKTA